jgi:hypothetical protein
MSPCRCGAHTLCERCQDLRCRCTPCACVAGVRTSLRALEEMAFYDRHGCSRAEWARRELMGGQAAPVV